MEPLLSIEQAAEVLGISAWTIRKWVANKKLCPVRLGRRVLLEPQELRRIVENNRTGAHTEATAGESR